MAEDQANIQDGAQPNPEATPPLNPVTGREGTAKSERAWLAERKKARATEQAVQSLKETPEPNPEPETEPTTETTRKPEDPQQEKDPEAQGSEGEDSRTEPETPESPEGEDEGYFPETLTEFAEAVGVKPEDFMQGVTATVKVNGEDQSVPLVDLLKNYSSEAERTRHVQALAEEKKALEAASQQREHEYQERLRTADEFLHALQASIQLGPSDQHLADALAKGQLDEKSYLVARSDRDSKVAAFNELLNKRNEMLRQRHEEAQQKQVEFRKQQQEGLVSWNPDLGDPGKLSAFESRVRGNLKDHYGFNDEEVSNFFGSYDLRQVKIVNDAIAYREMKAQEKPLRDKLKQLPKLQKPGPKRSEGQRANDKVLGARSRLRAQQSDESGVAFLRERRLAGKGTRRHGRSQ